VIEALYRGLTRAAAPGIALLLHVRAGKGKEDAARLGERWGHASRPRPAGKLIWVHAASVGEATSVLPLIARLTSRASVLVTTGTVTSAALLAERLPAGAFHQFAPVDVPRAVGRFFDFWRPDLGVWVESELWPNLVLGAAARGIPLALVQGRMSAESLKGWQRAPGFARRLVSAFRVLLAQTEADAERFRALGASATRVVGNLKFVAPPLPAEDAERARLAEALRGRKVWCAASTHDPEERIVWRVHRRLAAEHPGLLTIVVPRHPARGAAIAEALVAEGARLARRGAGETPDAATDVYLVDTLGELGLVYRLSPIVFVGGSLIDHGGQNPLEPARLDRAVLHGPSMFNFADAVAALRAAGASEEVADEAALAVAVERMLADPAEAARRGRAAGGVARAGQDALDAVEAALLPMIPAP
jgi:3-deoxy-D-manno-octulosonic-acid transferase